MWTEAEFECGLRRAQAFRRTRFVFVAICFLAACSGDTKSAAMNSTDRGSQHPINEGHDATSSSTNTDGGVPTDRQRAAPRNEAAPPVATEVSEAQAKDGGSDARADDTSPDSTPSDSGTSEGGPDTHDDNGKACSVDWPPVSNDSNTGHSPALCGSLDTPETGLQGDVPLADQQSKRANRGYNCGVALVGHNDLGGSGGDLAWSGECAYVKLGDGIKVLDMSNPFAPVMTDTLSGTYMSENIHAVTTADRALLVAAGVGPNGAATAPVPVDVWDVSNCTHPKKLGTATFPGILVHNLELTPDATKIFGSLPLQVADISDLSDPSSWTVRDFQCELAEQAKPGFTGTLFVPFATDRPACANQLAHEFEFNAAGTRMYIGGQQHAELAKQFDPSGPDWQSEEEFRVVDISVWPPKVLSTIAGAGHGVRRATIGGKPFVLHSNENVGWAQNGCEPRTGLPVTGVAQPELTDISDETAPRTISELSLGINCADEKVCAAEESSAVNATSHYHEVDNPDDTTFAMLSMVNAGLRVFDVRNPDKPIETAYFNPGQANVGLLGSTLDRAISHSHYHASTGHIWLTTVNGGIWVLELEPQVRSALCLPPVESRYPNGRAARAEPDDK